MRSSTVFEVIRAGLLDTVQDSGRPDAVRWGVPNGGAADPNSLAIANALLGNDQDAAAIEITLAGPTLRALTPTTVALAGADLGAHVAETGVRLSPGSSLQVRPGWTLVLDGPSTGDARTYLAVPGGLSVPAVLGSRSTALGAGFGGFGGRPLRAGDVLVAASAATPLPARWPGVRDASRGPALLRVTPGPHPDGPADPRLVALAATGWVVGAASDRMGVRLEGPAIPTAHGLAGVGGDLVSHGVRPGAVQVTPEGGPIVLLADAQPTGGYPVLAVVAAVDRPLLGQLRPGDVVQFVVVGRADATELLRARRAAFAAAVRLLREAQGWDELWHGAR